MAKIHVHEMCNYQKHKNPDSLSLALTVYQLGSMHGIYKNTTSSKIEIAHLRVGGPCEMSVLSVCVSFCECVVNEGERFHEVVFPRLSS